VLGALLVTASTGTLIYALIQAGDGGWLTATTGVLLLVAALGYLAFVMWQRRAGSPLMDVRLLARRPVATGTFLILLATALMIAVFFLGTFYFQHAHSYGPLRTGLLFLPVAVAALGMAVPALWLNTAAVVAGVSVAAAGTGAIFVVASATALGQVAPHEAGVASGIVSTFHEFGAAGGAAVVSSVAAASLAGDSLGGFTNAFIVAAVAAAAAAAVAAVLTPRS